MPTYDLALWHPGESLDHRKLNQPIAALRAITGGINPPRQVATRAKPKAGTTNLLACKVAATEALGLSGLGDVDGVPLNEGDPVMAWLQAAPEARGIYTASSGAWALEQAFDADWLYKIVAVAAGDTYGRLLFICTAPYTLQPLGGVYL